MARDRGWDYLNSSGNDFDFDKDNDGSWGYENEDGSGSFYGNDGSWGYKNSDGSASYYGVDGSWGYKNSDGSISYYGIDGSWGYRNSDGSGSYYGSDNDSEYYSSDNEDDDSYSGDSSGGSLLGAALCLGAFGIAAVLAGRSSNISYEGNENDGDEDEQDTFYAISDDLNDEVYDEEWERRKVEEEELRREQIRQQEQKEQAKKDKCKARWKRFWSTIAHKKMIDVNTNSSDCIGKNYLQVVSIFEKNGFSEIKLIILEDLEYDEISKENEVTDITVEGHNFFNLNTKAKFDSDVIITFHKLKKTNPPFSYKEIKGRSGKEAAEAFKNAGFVNVEENVIKDLTFGWLKKDGQIDSITVGDNSRYKADEANRIDVRVVVTYHTFKRDRRK